MKGIALMAAANAAADGREFNISNEGIPDAVPEG